MQEIRKISSSTRNLFDSIRSGLQSKLLEKFKTEKLSQQDIEKNLQWFEIVQKDLWLQRVTAWENEIEKIIQDSSAVPQEKEVKKKVK